MLREEWFCEDVLAGLLLNADAALLFECKSDRGLSLIDQYAGKGGCNAE
jgi:hypothetical protein